LSYRSDDRRFIVKSVRKTEFPFLCKIMQDYYTYLSDNAFHSLLPRFLGLYKVVSAHTLDEGTDADDAGVLAGQAPKEGGGAIGRDEQHLLLARATDAIG
jgi:hypothetical protein